MKKLICLLVLSVCLIGCAHFNPSTQVERERQKLLQSINSSDGIDKKEAAILAGEYFFRYVSACGVTGEPIDKGGLWEIEMYIGYVPTLVERRIHIDKMSGVISLEGGPTIRNPIKEWLSTSEQQ